MPPPKAVALSIKPMSRREANEQNFRQAMREARAYRQELITKLLSIIQTEDVAKVADIPVSFKTLIALQNDCRQIEIMLEQRDKPSSEDLSLHE